MGTATENSVPRLEMIECCCSPSSESEAWSSGRLAWLEITLLLSSLDSGYFSVLLQLEASGGRGQLSCVESLEKGLWILGENWKISSSRCLVLYGGHLTWKGE